MNDEQHYHINVDAKDGIRIWNNYFGIDENGEDTGETQWWDTEYFSPNSVNDSYMKENYLDATDALCLDETDCDDWHFYLRDNNTQVFVVDDKEYYLRGIRSEGSNDGQLEVRLIRYTSTNRGIEQEIVSIDYIECQ